jgi:hypothetical protein
VSALATSSLKRPSRLHRFMGEALRVIIMTARADASPAIPLFVFILRFLSPKPSLCVAFDEFLPA